MFLFQKITLGGLLLLERGIVGLGLAIEAAIERALLISIKLVSYGVRVAWESSQICGLSGAGIVIA